MLSALSCLPAAPRVSCVCRRRCTEFPLASSGHDLPLVVVLLLASLKSENC